MTDDANLNFQLRSMPDDDLLDQLNAHDPYDEEFKRRFVAMRHEWDSLKDVLLAIEVLTATGEGMTAEQTQHIHLLAVEGRADPAALRQDGGDDALAEVRRQERERCARLAWSMDEKRPWEHWAEDNDVIVAQTVAKEIAAAIRDMKDETDE